MSGTRRRRRDLSDDEKQLWDKIAESVSPLKPRRKRKRPPVIAPALTEPVIEVDHSAGPVSEASKTVHPPKPRPKKPKPAEPVAPAEKPRAGPTPLAPIDNRTKRKLVRGTVAIDGRIDLHGMTQHDAFAALRVFLYGAQARGAKMVLVITGKGRKGAPGAGLVHDPDERGILRRVVPQWLALPDLRGLVVGFEEAHLSHGGGGALYVRLRRVRSHGFDEERG